MNFRQRELDQRVVAEMVKRNRFPAASFGQPCNLCRKRCARECAYADAHTARLLGVAAAERERHTASE
jgi:hypothetical protein